MEFEMNSIEKQLTGQVIDVLTIKHNDGTIQNIYMNYKELMNLWNTLEEYLCGE